MWEDAGEELAWIGEDGDAARLNMRGVMRLSPGTTTQ